MAKLGACHSIHVVNGRLQALILVSLQPPRGLAYGHRLAPAAMSFKKRCVYRLSYIV